MSIFVMNKFTDITSVYRQFRYSGTHLVNFKTIFTKFDHFWRKVV